MAKTLPFTGSGVALVTPFDGYKTNYDELGRLIGYHPYYINRLMMAYTGTTLRHYVINCRINEAKRLLMTSEVSLSEVAEKSGFKSAYYFSRCFKEKTGFSPGKFRAARKNMV